MRNSSMSAAAGAGGIVDEAWQEVGASFERFCLNAGLATLASMMETDARDLCGPRYGRSQGKPGRRWGKTKGKVGFHDGKIEVERPRARPGRRRIGAAELGRRRPRGLARQVGAVADAHQRLDPQIRPLGAAAGRRHPGSGVSKSAASRRFAALSAERMKAWMSADLSRLDLLVLQIDGVHIREDLVLLAAVGVDGDGGKHPLAVMEGATENAAVRQALLDNLVGRGLDPNLFRLFVIDGAKALAKAIRNTFGRRTPIQRRQIHKARNIVERLPKSLHASVRKTLRQAWEIPDADKAEKLIVNLARRLEREAPGVSASILEGLDEILTVTRLGLPLELRRSLACTNIIENMNGTLRQVCRNVKPWQDAAMALRWASAAMREAKGFRKLKAYKQLAALRAALSAHRAKHAQTTLDDQPIAA
jgi:putative transposase